LQRVSIGEAGRHEDCEREKRGFIRLQDLTSHPFCFTLCCNPAGMRTMPQSQAPL
jgi:hypothetical protein